MGVAVHFGVDGAQALVPGHHVRERIGHHMRVHRACHPHGEGQVVSRSGDIEPIEEPDPLLCSGKGQNIWSRGCGERRSGTGSDLLRDTCGESHYSGCLEQRAYRNLRIECRADA